LESTEAYKRYITYNGRERPYTQIKQEFQTFKAESQVERKSFFFLTQAR